MINTIGGGPIGSYISSALSNKGYKVNLFEEHSKIGEPLQCTGIMSTNLLKNIKFNKNIILNKVKGAIIHSQNKSFTIETKKTKALIIDRTKFDQEIFRRSINNGTKHYLNYKYIGKKNDYILLKNQRTNQIYKTKKNTLIGADGPLSKVSNDFFQSQNKLIYGIQTTTKFKSNEEYVQVFLNENIPNFFGWIVPTDKNNARIGLATDLNPRVNFKRFLTKLKVKPNSIQAGLIPIYDPKKKIETNKTFLLGDAASQVKATSGGGVVIGLMAAKNLFKAITKNKQYSQLNYKINSELLLALKIRQKLNKFNNKDNDELLNKLLKSKKIIEKYGDMDFPSKLIYKLIINDLSLLKYIIK